MRLHRPMFVAGLAAGLTALAASPASAFLISAAGPQNDRASNPPNYTNCTACHTTNAVNSGNGSFMISGVPAEYVPGTVYPITVTISDPGQSRWGFEIAVFGENDTNIGATAITEPTRTQKSTSGSRSWIKHTTTGTSAGTPNGPVSWTFNWTAPSVPSGTAYFYASGNAANNNNTNGGDFIYNTATAAAPSGAAHADATIVLQPDTISFRRNRTVTVRARVRNHTAVAQSYNVVSRVRLPGGSFFPPTGSLLPPINLALAAEGFNATSLSHAIPGATPLITAVYEGHLQTTAGTGVDTDEFTFSVTP